MTKEQSVTVFDVGDVEVDKNATAVSGGDDGAATRQLIDEPSKCQNQDTQVLEGSDLEDVMLNERLQGLLLDEEVENRIVEEEIIERMLEEQIKDHMLEDLEDQDFYSYLYSYLRPRKRKGRCNCRSEFGVDDDGEVRHLGLYCPVD